MDKNQVKIMKYVTTGEVKSGGVETTLNSGAIGSCVVIVAFDSYNKTGAMAHIMLPGKSPIETSNISSRYAANAVEELLNQLFEKGAKKENIETCLLGGANVLKRANDTIAKDNITSVEDLLKELNIKVCAKSIGGTERRTTIFYINTGSVYFTLGDSKEELLWKY